MTRNSFSDIDKKRGQVGSNVVKIFYGKELGDVTTVKRIISTGRGGTRIYLTNGQYGKASDYKIID